MNERRDLKEIMVKDSIEQGANIFVCKDCSSGIIVFENSRGNVLNLKYIDKFLGIHLEVDIMTYRDFVSNNKTC